MGAHRAGTWRQEESWWRAASWLALHSLFLIEPRTTSPWCPYPQWAGPSPVTNKERRLASSLIVWRRFITSLVESLLFHDHSLCQVDAKVASTSSQCSHLLSQLSFLLSVYLLEFKMGHVCGEIHNIPVHLVQELLRITLLQ